MKIRIYSLILALGLAVFSSCDLDLQEDPNAITPDSASPDFMLNRIQLDFRNFYNGASNVGMALTRVINQFENTYENAYLPQSFDGLWTTAYANVLNDIQLLKELATEFNLNRHLGIAKTIEAYMLISLVDHFGDVPYSAAFDPTNFNPTRDNGQQLYERAFELLNEADGHFNDEGAGSPTDFFYRGNSGKWIKLINTLKLKYHLQRRLIDPTGAANSIAALANEDNFIGMGDDFAFQYGTLLADPDSRHPRYAQNYVNGAQSYQSTFYMWHLTEAKGFDDPRARYYLYRQTLDNPTDINENRCINEFVPNHFLILDMIFCLPGNRGYWGRDHLDNQGIPPDQFGRTNWGVYPAGGRFDDSSAETNTGQDQGALGAGIQPIMMSSFVDFMLAESALTLNTPGDPRALLLSGIEKSMSTVRNFTLNSQEGSVAQEFHSDGEFSDMVDDYLTYVSNEYNAASADGKLNVIMREYWLALYGNGIESYNNYRRTGKPDNMQPGLDPNFGNFPRSLLYPAVYVNTNNQADQKPNNQERVFWDNNPVSGWIY